MKKLLFKKRLGSRQNNMNHRNGYIKDKSVKYFILQHLKPSPIDFSKLKTCVLMRMASEENMEENPFPQHLEQVNGINPNHVSSLFRCPNIF